MKFSSSSTLVAAVVALSMAKTVKAAFEWAGAFPTNDTTHQWSMQSIDGEYADNSMRLVIYATDTASQEAIEANEESATTLIEDDSCTVVQAGDTFGPFDATGSCNELVVDTNQTDSLFIMDTENISAIVVFAQHNPKEFERDMHYFQDSAGNDIEPEAEEGGDGGHDHDHGHDHSDHEDEGSSTNGEGGEEGEDTSGAAVASVAGAAIVGATLLMA